MITSAPARARRPRGRPIGYASARAAEDAHERRARRLDRGDRPSARSPCYLNPGLVAPARGCRRSSLCLFLPWAAGGTLALALAGRAPRPRAALVAAAVPARGRRPPLLRRRSRFVALAAVAALYWHNLLAYRHAMPVDGAARARRLRGRGDAAPRPSSSPSASTSSLFPRHDRPLAAALAILAPAAALAVPLALRPALPPPAPPVPVPARRGPAGAPRRRGRRSTGSRPRTSTATGRRRACPRFARLARRGRLRRRSRRCGPPRARPVWTTLMTGRLPRDHGIRSASTLPAARLGQRVGPAAQGGPRRRARARVGSRRAGPSPPRRAGGAPCGTCSTRSASRPASCGSGARTRRRRSAASSSPPTSTCCAATPSARAARRLPARPARRGRARARSGRATSTPRCSRELADAAAPAATPLDDPLLRRARRGRARPRPHVRAGGGGAAPGVRSLAPRRVVPRLRRGRARVLPLRAPRGLRQRGRRRGAPLRPRAGPLRGSLVERWVGEHREGRSARATCWSSSRATGSRRRRCGGGSSAR